MGWLSRPVASPSTVLIAGTRVSPFADVGPPSASEPMLTRS